MNDPESQITVSIELDDDPALEPAEIHLVADLLPDLILDILQMAAELED